MVQRRQTGRIRRRIRRLHRHRKLRHVRLVRRQDALTSDANRTDVDALIEFLVQQAAHKNVTIDAAKAARGRELAIGGAWNGDLEGIDCAQCHMTIGEKFKPVFDEDSSGPTLAQYASAAWLKDFINNPAADWHYGAKDRMSGFAGKMSEQELTLLVRWLTGDYYPTNMTAAGETEQSQ